MALSAMEIRLERAKQEGDTAFIELAAFVEYVCANGDEIPAHICKYAYEVRDTLGDRIPEDD